mgnify:CR=1 FL=1
MSRRKDRERALAQKRLNPDYPGFRGYQHEPGREGSIPLTTAVCSICGRRRNVPVVVAQEQGEKFVCISCQQTGVETVPPEANSDEDSTAEDEKGPESDDSKDN